jgi:hypothetical protein
MYRIPLPITSNQCHLVKWDQGTHRSSIICSVSLEWCILALSIKITLFGSGNGFIRSRRESIKCRKVIALKEPSTMLTCRTPSKLMTGKTEYLKFAILMVRVLYSVQKTQTHLLPRSYETSTVALAPRYDHPKLLFMLRASTAASSIDTSWLASYCCILSMNSALRTWLRSRATRASLGTINQMQMSHFE